MNSTRKRLYYVWRNLHLRKIPIVPEWEMFSTFWNDVKATYIFGLHLRPKENHPLGPTNFEWVKIPTKYKWDKERLQTLSKAGISQHQIAAKLGINQSTVSRALRVIANGDKDS